MISFIQLPYRKLHPAQMQEQIGPLATAVILALILCLELALVVSMFFKN
jgi:hypothetical protein